MALNEEKATKLQALLKLLDEGITKKDFIQSFKTVVDSVKKLEDKLQTQFDALSARMDDKLASLKDGVDGKDGKDGKDGVDGADGKDGEDGQDAELDMNALVKQVTGKDTPDRLETCLG